MCKELNGGEWLAPFPEKYFTRLEKKQPIWSPQYVMHKLLMGLTYAYLDAGNRQALQIIEGLRSWYLKWTERMQSVNPHAVYSGEEAGMLEILYPQFEHTYTVFPWKQNTYLTKKQPENFILRPLYEITDEPYTVYFTQKPLTHD